MNFIKNKKGFTLVELLVVISIIGFLASSAMYSLNSARVGARDVQRKTDFATLAKALELYYDDYGHYPVSNCWGCEGVCPTNRDILYPESELKGANAYSSGHSSNKIIATLKNRGYISSYISDPLDPEFEHGNKYYYYTDEEGQHFALMVNLEKPTADDWATVNLSPPAQPPLECGATPNKGRNYRVTR